MRTRMRMRMRMRTRTRTRTLTQSPTHATLRLGLGARALSRSSEPLPRRGVLHVVVALAEIDQLVRDHAAEFLDRAGLVGPAHLDRVDRARGAQAERELRVVLHAEVAV